jgi:hypothetical protein
MTRWPAFIRLLLPLGLYAATISPAFAAQIVPRPASSFLKTALMQVATTNAATPSDGLTLTLPDGSETKLQVSLVIRIRKALASESARGAKTRIDWLDTMLVRESPEAVAASIGATLPSLGKLLMPDRSPIWFNVLSAYGPMPLSIDKMQNGILSGMILGGKIQYLASAPEQVHAEITARGGSPLPIPGSSVIASQEQQGGSRSIVGPLEVWDADIPQ